MSKTVIGLTASRTPRKNGMLQIGVAEAYVQSVVRANGVPVIIPLGLAEADIEALLAKVDGIIFTGGGDILPQRYNSASHPLVNFVDEDRDRVEIALFHEIFEHNLPFLGICRGLQVVNVALGGTLYEDIGEQHPGAIAHQYSEDKPRDYRAHSVDIDPQSRLFQIIQSKTIMVNSLHHQGIRLLAPRLGKSSTAPDGIIEAIELENYIFGLAVQWHPEWMADDPSMSRLFSALVEASSTGDI